MIEPQVLAYAPSRLTPREAALIAARVAGCACEPDVEIRDVHAFIRHDDWCPVLRKGDVN